MSSHREAPEISKDPVADNTDVYAFVSPERPTHVTLIANFNPFQKPDAGPNFYEFGEDVLYQIHVSHGTDAKADVTYQFRFRTEIRNKNTFLYNTGQIKHITDPTWNRPQYYSVSRVPRGGRATVLAQGLMTPPVNVGVRSTPDYAHFTGEATHHIAGGRTVFAGQRADPFHVDLGSVFDLGGLRPFNNAHLIKERVMPGIDGLKGLNVSTIAIQVPIADLTRHHNHPTNVMDPGSVIGVWASASRQRSRVYHSGSGMWMNTGPFVQVSRLAFPLFNELLVPMARKDLWNANSPYRDKQFADGVLHPELAGLLPVLYPGVFPHLAAYKKPRADLSAIILTGIPKGVIPGFQNYTGPVLADMIRLNVAVKPATKVSNLGIIGGDLAGFPNGRRVPDDAVTVELRAVAGALIPLVDPSFKPDAVAAKVTDGTKNDNPPYLKTFPYVGTPAGGYQSGEGTPRT